MRPSQKWIGLLCLLFASGLMMFWGYLELCDGYFSNFSLYACARCYCLFAPIFIIGSAYTGLRLFAGVTTRLSRGLLLCGCIVLFFGLALLCLHNLPPEAGS